jgi:hypothetical protein
MKGGAALILALLQAPEETPGTVTVRPHYFFAPRLRYRSKNA